MGLNSEHVEKPFVFVCFFGGSRGARVIQENKQLSSPWQFLVEKGAKKEQKGNK